jgi:hypothetical protein
MIGTKVFLFISGVMAIAQSENIHRPITEVISLRNRLNALDFAHQLISFKNEAQNNGTTTTLEASKLFKD